MAFAGPGREIPNRNDSLEESSGTNKGYTGPKLRSFHIQLPQSRLMDPNNPGHHDDSDQNDSLNEEEVQNVLGISIGREQSRLRAPTTPATEWFAATANEPSWGFFDGPGNDEQEPSVGGHAPSESQSGTCQSLQSSFGTNSPPAANTPCLPGIPSPWTASSKMFETPSPKEAELKSKGRRRAATGPANSFASLGVTRFLSGLGLSTLSDQLPFGNVSLPRVPSVLGKLKSEHETDSAHGSRRTGSTTRPKFFLLRGSLSRPCSTERIDTPSPDLNDGSNAPQSSYQKSLGVNDTHMLEHDVHKTSQGIRRTKSEQSLSPSIALSNMSSLGDDLRWEKNHKQLNSRLKAIMDSLQDSNMKLPSLPSLSLNSLLFDSRNKRSCESSLRFPNDQGDLMQNSVGAERYEGTHVSQAEMGMRKTTRHSSHKVLDAALENLTGDVVVLGGYRGSILRSTATNQQVWVPLKVGLNLRKVNLEVGLEPRDEEEMEKYIYPSGMLENIGIVDISKRLIKRLRHCKNALEGRLNTWSYGFDWRLSPALLSRNLVRFLEGLDCRATVIAHSLGGLITRHAVNQRPELFAGVVYAGVPQHCVNILGPLRNGDEVLLSAKVLTAQVNFSIRTSFVLLPESGHCFFDKDTKEEYPVNFFDVEDWKRYAFSPCIAAPAALPPTERRGLLGSFSNALPSFNGGTFGSKRSSIKASNPKEVASDVKDAASKTADSAASKATNIAQPQDRVLAPQLPFCEPPSSTSTNSTIPLPAALAYLERTLAETLAFKQALAHRPEHSADNVYPPLAVIYSTSSPTVYGARVSGRDGIRRVDAYDDLAFASGDGVVLARAAMVPEGYRTAKGGRVKTERGHVGLLGDLEAVGKCLLALAKARDQGVGLGVGEER